MITTLLQHRFYSDDADVYVPYSAPFFNTDRDSSSTAWTTHGQERQSRLRGDKTYTVTGQCVGR